MRATPNPDRFFTGLQIRTEGPSAAAPVMEDLNQAIFSAVTLHDNGTEIRPSFIEPNMMWAATVAQGEEKVTTVYMFDGTKDMPLYRVRRDVAGGGPRIDLIIEGEGAGGGGGNISGVMSSPIATVPTVVICGASTTINMSCSTLDTTLKVVSFLATVGNQKYVVQATPHATIANKWEGELTFNAPFSVGQHNLLIVAQGNDGSQSVPSILYILKTTESFIKAPIITTPASNLIITSGNINLIGNNFLVVGASDTQKSIHGKIVLADDPNVVIWQDSKEGAFTQISASWAVSGEGQDNLLCQIAYEGIESGLSSWSEPIPIRLVKSGISTARILWPLNGEQYADPNLLRCNAERPIIKNGTWTGTEWQASDVRDFSSILVNLSITDTIIEPNRVWVDLNLNNKLSTQLFLRCRHLSTSGIGEWSDLVEVRTAAHQTFWEFGVAGAGTFTPPASGTYEIMCIGGGGAYAGYNLSPNPISGGGGGGSGYITINRHVIEQGVACAYKVGNVQENTTFLNLIANCGGMGSPGGAGNQGGPGGTGVNGGGGGGCWKSVHESGSHDSGAGGVGLSYNGGAGGGTYNSGTAGSGGGGTGGPAGDANWLANGGGGGGGGLGGAGGEAGSWSSGQYKNYVPRPATASGYGCGITGSVGNYSIGGGAGGYGGGSTFPQEKDLYSKNLPYKNFNTITDGRGYIRIMYKGPNN